MDADHPILLIAAEGYGALMGLLEAAAWGLIGGLSAGLLALSVTIASNNFRWPEHDQHWPRAVVAVIGMLLGAFVAGAAHGQITGEWPALIMGASAPSVLRGALSRVEVVEAKTGTGDQIES